MAQGKKVTDEQWKKFEEMLPTTLGLAGAACEKLGINRWTYYNHRYEDRAFAKRCDEIILNQVGIPYARDKLMEAIFRGEAWSILFYLKCIDPKFKPKSKVEIDGTIKTMTQKIDVTPEARKVLEIWRYTYDKQFEQQSKRTKRGGTKRAGKRKSGRGGKGRH